MLNVTRCPIGTLLLTAFDVKSVVNNKSFLQKVRHLSQRFDVSRIQSIKLKLNYFSNLKVVTVNLPSFRG